MIAGDTVPKLPRGVRLHHDKARGGWTVLGPERVIETDAIGAEILRRCDGRPFAAIVDDLAATFAADHDLIATDVDRYLTDLAEKRLLELVVAAPPEGAAAAAGGGTP